MDYVIDTSSSSLQNNVSFEVCEVLLVSELVVNGSSGKI
jgi:hypothetical protein